METNIGATVNIFQVMSIIEQTYRKILLVDPYADTFQEIKIMKQEKSLGQTFSSWWDRYAEMKNIHPDDIEKFLSFRKNIHDKAALQYRRKTAGEWEWVFLEVIPYTDKLYLMLIKSANVYKDRLDNIYDSEYDNFHDTLTRVCNKRAFDITVNNCKGPLWIMYFDLNDVRKYNDYFSHENGDRYIQTCAKVIREFFRTDDIYRYSGDEFIVLSECGTQRFANIRMNIRKRFDENGINVAIGQCTYEGPNSRRILKEAIQEAERRMKKDKEEIMRTNCYMYRKTV